MTPEQLFQARHPDYILYRSWWQYFRDAAEAAPVWATLINPLFEGMAQVITGQNLVGVNRYLTQHRLESNDAYLARLQRAAVVDICGPAISLYSGTVGKQGTVIYDLPGSYKDLEDDADLMGSSLQAFLTDAREKAAVFGHTFILTDSTKSTDAIRTEADLQRQRIRPYFRIITPQDMLMWRLDGNGLPLEIAFQVKLSSRASLLDSDEQTDIIQLRYWSRTEWRVYEKAGGEVKLIDQGPNPIGAVPVSVLYHRKLKPFIGESLIKQASRFQALLTNWLSAMDSTMQLQSFSQACLRSESKPSEVGVGSNVVLHLKPASKDDGSGEEDFFYRSPDAAPIATMWDSFARLVVLANKSMNLAPEAIDGATKAESGISKAWKWYETTKRLDQMVTHEQSCVDMMMYHAALWKGDSSFPGSIRYSNRFNLNDLAEDIAIALQLETLGLPPTARKYVLQQCIAKALPALPDDVETQIQREIDERMTAAAAVNNITQTAANSLITSEMRQTSRQMNE